MTVWLGMQTPDGGVRQFVVSAVRTTIGRAAQCDIRVALPSVALQHCEIINDGGTITLRNLDAETPTRVNGGPVDTQELRDNDRIEVGPVRFTMHIGEPTSGSAATTEIKPPRDTASRKRTRV